MKKIASIIAFLILTSSAFAGPDGLTLYSVALNENVTEMPVIHLDQEHYMEVFCWFYSPVTDAPALHVETNSSDPTVFSHFPAQPYGSQPIKYVIAGPATVRVYGKGVYAFLSYGLGKN